MGFLDWLLGRGGESTVEGTSGGSGGPEQPEPRRRKGKPRITKIKRSVLQMVAEAAKDAHPNEFGGILRAKDDTIVELLLSPGGPGAMGGSSHIFMYTEKLPMDASLVGTVHTHPSPEAFPSYADRQFFSSFGHIHIIMAAPYDPDSSWRAYDQTGADRELEIVG